MEQGQWMPGSYATAVMETGVICNWWRKLGIISGDKKEEQGAFHASDLGIRDGVVMVIDWQHRSDEIKYGIIE